MADDIIQLGKFNLDIQKTFFFRRVMQCWNRLPQEAVTPPSLKVPKTVLDHGQLGLVFMTVPTGWRPNKSPHKSPPLKISRIL